MINLYKLYSIILKWYSEMIISVMKSWTILSCFDNSVRLSQVKLAHFGQLLHLWVLKIEFSYLLDFDASKWGKKRTKIHQPARKMMRLIRQTASKTTFDITPFKFIHLDRHHDYKKRKFHLRHIIISNS